jgi:hypothetical protein
MIDEFGKQYDLCVVANIIDKHLWGEQKELRRGTKHFVPGAKLYCVLMYGGMGHEHIMVLGKPRKSFRMIEVVMRRSYIKNFRIQKVYSKRIIEFLQKYPYGPVIHETDNNWLASFQNDNNIEEQ